MTAAAGGPEQAPGGRWLAGVAEVDITPPVGAPLAGYAHRTEPSTHVLDPLRAQALVLDDGTRRVALVALDLIGVGADLVERARARIAETAGIPPAHVLVACSHTHAGPSGPWRPGDDDPYVVGLPDRIAGAVRAAARVVRPALLSAGAASCDSVQANRREVGGPIDPEVAVLRVEDAGDGRLVAALVAFACHPTVLEPSQLGISADYPGAVRDVVRTICGPAAVVLFANGACADINPVKRTQDPGETRRVGAIVGASAARVLEELRTLPGGAPVHTPAVEVPGSPLAWGSAPKAPGPRSVALRPHASAARRSVALPTRAIPEPADVEAAIADARQRLAGLRPHDPERRRERFLLMRLDFERRRGPRAAGTREVEVQALALGGALVFVTAPGELFVEIGLGVKRALAGRGLFPVVVGYANDAAGYLPTDTAFDWHGYEVAVSAYDRGAEPALRGAMLACVEAALAPD